MNTMNKIAAENIIWGLDDLYKSFDDPAIEADKLLCMDTANKFIELYSGRVDALSPEAFYKAVSILEGIEEVCEKIITFAYLSFVTETDNTGIGKLLQDAREFDSAIRSKTLFFTLEWTKASSKYTSGIMNYPALSNYHHYLEKLKMFSDHRLSEPEEQIITAQLPVGRQAWATLFDKVTGSMRFGGKKDTLAQTLGKLYLSERTVRKRAAEDLTTGLEGSLYILSHIFNNIILDKAITDRLLSYREWTSKRNIENQVSDSLVHALVEKVTKRYDIVQRYYNVKKKLLGHDKLWDFDRSAPLPGILNKKYSWDESKNIVIDAFYDFSPTIGNIASLFFKQQWIHAPALKGKVNGAFSHPAVPSAHPFILVNFTRTHKDLMTLAHEVGHGIHQFLSREQGLFNCRHSPVTAETASVFGEMTIFYFLLKRVKSKREKLALICSKIEDYINTIFRQTALFSFENRVHKARGSDGELETAQINRIWMETQKMMYKDSIHLSDHYSTWWAYIPHFIHYPGYVYAYAFAELTALSLFHLYTRQNKEFVPVYIEFLKNGGKFDPEKLLKPFGIKLDDQIFTKGINIIESLLNEAEQLSTGASIR